MSTFKELLLQAPNSQLDHSLFPLIEKWDDPATALQILEVLDQCINAALASGFTVSLLQNIYNGALLHEDKDHEDVVKLATWRIASV
jgi:hypothetical protein